MPVETFSYLDSLVATNPVTADGLVNGDDHIRGIKSALKATFPNITGAVTSTQTELDAIAALLVSGVLRANGAVPAGAVQDFAMATAPTGWLECNGAAVSRTTYADLFAAIGTTWGSGDGSTTFNLPPDRYRVGRNAAAAVVGTLQTSQNKSHTHTGSGTTATESVGHSHTFSGTTATENADHTHTEVRPSGAANLQAGADFTNMPTGSSAVQTGGISNTHAHLFSGTTSDRSAAHTHTYSFTTSAGSADTGEARPLSAVFLTCIKT